MGAVLRAVIVLCYAVGAVRGGDADLDAVNSLFGVVYVLNPGGEGVFAQRRALMAEMLSSCLPPELPVHMMGV
jgi:hypothetical protein